MRRITGLQRAIDPRVQSNRYVVLVTVVAGAVAFAAAPSDDRIRTAFTVAGSAFLGWALGREVDPDRSITATLAAPAAGLVAWIDATAGHPASLGAIYLVMLTARILVRSTGRPPTTLDLALHLGVVVWLAWGSIGWVPAVGLAVALVLDTRLPVPAPTAQLWWGGAMGVAASLVAGLTGDTPLWIAPRPVEWVPMAIGVLGAIFLIRPESVLSLADTGDSLLHPQRLLVARIAIGVSAVLISVVGGANGISAIGAVWAVLAAGGLVRIVGPDRRL